MASSTHNLIRLPCENFLTNRFSEATGISSSTENFSAEQLNFCAYQPGGQLTTFMVLLHPFKGSLIV
jgi:hypothetical protein